MKYSCYSELLAKKLEGKKLIRQYMAVICKIRVGHKEISFENLSPLGNSWERSALHADICATVHGLQQWKPKATTTLWYLSIRDIFFVSAFDPIWQGIAMGSHQLDTNSLEEDSSSSVWRHDWQTELNETIWIMHSESRCCWPWLKAFFSEMCRTYRQGGLPTKSVWQNLTNLFSRQPWISSLGS